MYSNLDRSVRVVDCVECGEHVVTVEQRKQSLGRFAESAEFHAVRSDNHPAGNQEAGIENDGTGHEAKHVR